jgi:metallo-beta-lactamase family protein
VDWLRSAKRPPRIVFAVHGEPESSQALQRDVVDRLGWSAVVPRFGERVRVD